MISHNEVLKTAKRVEMKRHPGAICFSVDRDRMYPLMLQHMAERVKAYPAWKVTHESIAQIYTKARGLPAEADLLARTADGPGGLDERQRALRGMALETAREWFTQLLHLKAGLKPIVIRLEGGKDRWRL